MSHPDDSQGAGAPADPGWHRRQRRQRLTLAASLLLVSAGCLGVRRWITESERNVWRPGVVKGPRPPPQPVSATQCCVHAGNDSVCIPEGTVVAFRENALCERGTTVSLFDYADAFERLACGRAVFSAWKTECEGVTTRRKFEDRFGADRVLITGDPNWASVDEDVDRLGVSTVYAQLIGRPQDTLVRPACARMVVHAVFDGRRPHGDAFALISEEVVHTGDVPVVPYIVQRHPSGLGDMRGELGIPPDATVFCRHGGGGTFDIPFVRQALCGLLRETADDPGRPYFVFLGTYALECAADVAAYGRVTYLPSTPVRNVTYRFLNTCNACMHGRASGESFGLAVAECANAGLPVITHGGKGVDGDHHHTVLGPHALLYFNGEQFAGHIRAFDPAAHRAKADVYRQLYLSSQPEYAMLQFLRVFGIGQPIKC